MDIFVSYKQSWIDNKILFYKLNKIRKALNLKWKSNYIFFLDTNFKNMSPKDIIQESLNKIKESKEILCFIDSKEKSEGMLIELWIAKAFWKKINIYIQKDCINSFWSIKWLSDNIIIFNNFEDFINKLNYSSSS